MVAAKLTPVSGFSPASRAAASRSGGVLRSSRAGQSHSQRAVSSAVADHFAVPASRVRVTSACPPPFTSISVQVLGPQPGPQLEAFVAAPALPPAWRSLRCLAVQRAQASETEDPDWPTGPSGDQNTDIDTDTDTDTDTRADDTRITDTRTTDNRTAGTRTNDARTAATRATDTWTTDT